MKTIDVAYIKTLHDDLYEINNQKIIIEFFARKNGMKINKYYIDKGIFGYKHSQLKKMLFDVRNTKNIRRLIIKDISVLGRKYSCISRVIDYLNRENIEIVVINSRDIIEFYNMYKVIVSSSSNN